MNDALDKLARFVVVLPGFAAMLLGYGGELVISVAWGGQLFGAFETSWSTWGLFSGMLVYPFAATIVYFCCFLPRMILPDEEEPSDARRSAASLALALLAAWGVYGCWQLGSHIVSEMRAPPDEAASSQKSQRRAENPWPESTDDEFQTMSRVVGKAGRVELDASDIAAVDALFRSQFERLKRPVTQAEIDTVGFFYDAWMSYDRETLRCVLMSIDSGHVIRSKKFDALATALQAVDGAWTHDIRCQARFGGESVTLWPRLTDSARAQA